MGSPRKPRNLFNHSFSAKYERGKESLEASFLPTGKEKAIYHVPRITIGMMTLERN